MATDNADYRSRKSGGVLLARCPLSGTTVSQAEPAPVSMSRASRFVSKPTSYTTDGPDLHPLTPEDNSRTRSEKDSRSPRNSSSCEKYGQSHGFQVIQRIRGRGNSQDRRQKAVR
jgi:hypothetical protein